MVSNSGLSAPFSAASFSCYTCTDEPSNWNCLKPIKCADTDKYCLTTYASGGIGLGEYMQYLSKVCLRL
uniref:Snake toxin/toxin-like domain-containing protein n=1 Tax=Chelydra serpentina TaxID=8475 RepID=A0A8C3SXJ0_CHESE